MTEPDHPTAAQNVPIKREVEAATLAAYLAGPDEAIEYASGLTGEHFHDPQHHVIWEAISSLVNEGRTPDLITVGDRVCTTHPAMSGTIYPYLGELAANSTPPVSIASYLPALQVARTARRTLEAGRFTQGLATQIMQGSSDQAKQTLTKAQDAVFSVVEDAGVHESMVRIGTSIPVALDELDAESDNPADVFATGLIDLDKLLNGGLRPGELTVIAARPGIGKSTLAMDILRRNAIEDGQTCAMFSLEMSQTECITRVLAAEAEVPVVNLRSGSTPTERDWGRLEAAIKRISDSPLYIDATPGITMNYLNAQARYMVRRHNLKIIVVDYLQLMIGSTGEKRNEVIADISRQLKILAKETNTSVIAVAQLNRGPEQRPDKRPQTSDLRESGQIEQDADTIMLLYREDSFDPASTRGGEADVIVGKSRHAKAGTVTTGFQGEYSRFVSLAPLPPY